MTPSAVYRLSLSFVAGPARRIAAILLEVLLIASSCALPRLLRADDARPSATDGNARRPNILLVMADDMGFSDIGCYGSEIATPHLDALAAGGLRFTQFYNTARCWPTRGALLTGYYPQQLHMDPPQGLLPQWTKTLPQLLHPLGYRCYHTGKWHVSGAPHPVADGGFDLSYTLDDHDRNFAPRYQRLNDKPLPAVDPSGRESYYSTTAFADHCIECLKDHAKSHKDSPFFAYLAFTVPHFPLQAPSDDIARVGERYQMGWDSIRQARWTNLKKLGIVNCDLAPLETELGPRNFSPSLLEKIGPGELARPLPWNKLTAEQQAFQARKMAVHAAMIERMDREIGRVLDQVKQMQQAENTIVIFLSDNGASSEMLVRGNGHDPAAPAGSAGSFLCLGPGWSSAANTPFRRHKMWTHEGGIATPLVVHWPRGIAARGELRHDISHVVDLVPTLLELAGDEPKPSAGAPSFPGTSLVKAFSRDGATSREYVYFQHEGNRGIRQGDFKLVSAKNEGNQWELYDLKTDRCEQHNLAADQPERVLAMTARWEELQSQFAQDAGPIRRPPGEKEGKPAPSKPNPAPAAPPQKPSAAKE